ncbi:MAG: hypothetical protein U9P00_06525 [Pseudomonadota bacterium]|nr:hypothetical protein [Pseudomonadota bacterium]
MWKLRVIFSTILTMCLVFTFNGLAISAETSSTGTSDDAAYEESLTQSDRDTMIDEIVFQWGINHEDAQALKTTLEDASDRQITAAWEAQTYDDVVDILAGESMALGDTDEDYTFTPVTPCRIVDTRIAGGPLTAGTTRSFFVHGTVSGQGGNSSGCTSPLGEPRGVMINITAVPATYGHFRVYPSDVSTPNASILNYSPGIDIANAAAVKTGYNVGEDIEIYSAGTSHLVIDVLGYYHQPGRALPDQYVTSSGPVSIGTGTQSIWSPACPSDYRLTGGGGGLGSWTSDVPMVSTRPVDGQTIGLVSGTNAADRYVCQFNNRSGANTTVYCLAICARTPGR